jgi:dolichyl-phosphate-mannose--protein O-mannosyl transferase
LKHDFDQNFWSSYESFDHPQLSKYIFGASLYTFNPKVFETRDLLERSYDRWQFYFDPRISAISSTEFAPYILQMRQINWLFTTATVAVLAFILGKFSSFKLLSLAAPVALVFNPLFTESMLRATSDAQMVFFVMAVVALLISHSYQNKRSWLIATGITIGCAVAAKLTGAIVGYSVLFFEIILSQEWGYKKMIQRLVFIIAVSFIVWYGTNPGLYRSPISGSWRYLQFRTDQSIRLAKFFPEVKLSTMNSRLGATYCELINPSCSRFRGTVTPFILINITLLFFGIIALYILRKTLKTPVIVVTVFTITTMILNTVILPLYSDRYFLLPLIVMYLIDGVGAIWIVTHVLSHLRRKDILQNFNSV